ncbi:kinesin-like protein KIF20B [Thalassophryne amazonica]|uniref:kinesin-like protein KIF20B n=1 Tax=Thalassophryne amazonica TaxID=390379 RepID=UPI0014712631|nr:kinesin-like protein KIF20B [Thalassophryne amazonica]
MMHSSLAGKPDLRRPVQVDDIKRDLLSDFSALPLQVSAELQTENLQVFLRVRPFMSSDNDCADSQECVAIEGPDTVVLKAPRSYQPNRQGEKPLPQTAQRFTFTQVFGPEATQRKVFEGSVRGLVQDVLEGGNCLVFTYGVTNAGKTFTFVGPDHDSGLLPRSLSVIFNSIGERLYSRCDLKPQRCRDFSRLTPDQQAAEITSKKNLFRLLKESDKNSLTSRSALLEASTFSGDGSMNSTSEADSFCLGVSANIRFSVWVSFCEIYNDNIHDLLEQVPSGNHKRTVLRLSQDVKGNSFIKDLRWVQVDSSEEAYKVMKIGKKNQSISSTRLNQLSSRSHSIFSVRIVQVEDVGVPRVIGISELALCDLAGSERCSRTQNSGERLKEAGNINSSLLTLGKCISAMRLNQHAKFRHHVPFRESKLTHFLQFFFCGSGHVSMVVNINQSATCFDETLNVLKFSALAQKVVVLNSRPALLDDAPQRSAMELSMIINDADRRRNVSGRGRKSSLVAWETSLEDVQEDEDGEEWEEDEESLKEGTVLEAGDDEEEEQEEEKTTMDVDQDDVESSLRLVLETQIREEVCAEFMELYKKMEKDYSDRIEREREMLEERAEKRIEILKNLVNKTLPEASIQTVNTKEADLEGLISAVTDDLQRIREDAQSVHRYLSEPVSDTELEALRLENRQSRDQLQEVTESLKQQQQKVSELIDICQQKDDIINKLQATVDSTIDDATRDRALVESIRSELVQLQLNCRCLTGGDEEDKSERRKRLHEAVAEEEQEEGRPARKRAILEEEIWRLQEINDQKEEIIVQLRQTEEVWKDEKTRLEEELRRKDQEMELEKERMRLEEDLRKSEEEAVKERTRLEEKLRRMEEEAGKERTRLEEELRRMEEEAGKERMRLEEELRRMEEEAGKERTRLEEEVQRLTGSLELECPNCDSLFFSLESEQRETTRLMKENKALVNGIFQLQTEVASLQKQLKEQVDTSASLSEKLNMNQTCLQALESQSEEKTNSINTLTKQVECLQQELQEEQQSSSSVFSSTIEELMKESQAALERSAQKSEQLEALQREKTQLERTLSDSENMSKQLKEEMANQTAQFSHQLQSLKVELERVEEERRRAEQMEKEERGRVISEKEKLLKDSHRKIEQLQQELWNLKEADKRRRERVEAEEKENMVEERKVSIVEGLKEELQRHQERSKRRSKEFESGRGKKDGEHHLQEHMQSVHLSPLRTNMADTDRTPRTTRKKRKRSDVEDLVFSENKRNRLRANSRNNKMSSVVKQRDMALGELIQSSPSGLSCKGKNVIGLLSKHPTEKESITTLTKAKRGRRKLYKMDVTVPLLDSPHTPAEEADVEKESDHVIIKRQLRSKTSRK